jgi:UDP-2,4-diacetamido-2,4,6-trideoxy-beta-L-altropyranose hydrolase
VDHYGLDARWEASVAGDRRVLVLDDLANRAHHCSVLCDQNWYGPDTAHRYDGLVGSDCLLLLGPRYAVLQAQYRELIATRPPITWPPARILVSFGGTDPGNETEKAIASLADPRFSHLHVDVVVGSPTRVTDRLVSIVKELPHGELHVAVPSLAPLLARADLAIGASGAGTWERICLGVPAIVATSSPHQSGVTKALAASGLTDWIGLATATDVAAYREALISRMSLPRPTIPRVVDGLGTARLAEALFPTPSEQLELRRATPADTAALAGLEGEYRGVGPSLLDGPATWQSEALRLATAPSDPEAGPLVVELAGVPVGGIWFGPKGQPSILLQLVVQRRRLEADIERRLDSTSGIVRDP